MECLDSQDRLPVTKNKKQTLSVIKTRVSKRLMNYAQAEDCVEQVHILIDEINSLTDDEKSHLIKADPSLKIKRKETTYYAEDVFWSNIFHELLPLMDNASVECHGA